MHDSSAESPSHFPGHSSRYTLFCSRSAGRRGCPDCPLVITLLPWVASPPSGRGAASRLPRGCGLPAGQAMALRGRLVAEIMVLYLCVTHHHVAVSARSRVVVLRRAAACAALSRARARRPLRRPLPAAHNRGAFGNDTAPRPQAESAAYARGALRRGLLRAAFDSGTLGGRGAAPRLRADSAAHKRGAPAAVPCRPSMTATLSAAPLCRGCGPTTTRATSSTCALPHSSRATSTTAYDHKLQQHTTIQHTMSPGHVIVGLFCSALCDQKFVWESPTYSRIVVVADVFRAPKEKLSC